MDHHRRRTARGIHVGAVCLLIACGADRLDKTGKLMFGANGKVAAADGVKYRLEIERTELAQRKERDGTSKPTVSKARLATAPFAAGEWGKVEVDVSFASGKASGKLVIGGKPCAVTRLYYGSGSYQDVKYDPGFMGSCKLEGEADELEFTVGVVPP